MIKMTMEKDITQIKVAIGKVEQHLKDINGKMVDCYIHRSQTCPNNRKDIYDKISSIKESTTKNGVFIALAQTVIVGLMVAFMTGYIG